MTRHCYLVVEPPSARMHLVVVALGRRGRRGRRTAVATAISATPLGGGGGIAEREAADGVDHGATRLGERRWGFVCRAVVC